VGARKIFTCGAAIDQCSIYQTWVDYITNIIDYDYIESNHDCNRDYIYLEISSERKQNPFASFDVSILSDNIRYE